MWCAQDGSAGLSLSPALDGDSGVCPALSPGTCGLCECLCSVHIPGAGAHPKGVQDERGPCSPWECRPICRVWGRAMGTPSQGLGCPTSHLGHPAVSLGWAALCDCRQRGAGVLLDPRGAYKPVTPQLLWVHSAGTLGVPPGEAHLLQGGLQHLSWGPCWCCLGTAVWKRALLWSGH